MPALITAELVMGVCVLLLVLVLAWTFVRRRLIARGGDIAVVALRTVGGRWHTGLLRQSRDTLDWYPLIGLSPQPRWSWSRGSLDLGNVTTSDELGAYDGARVGRAMIVRCSGVETHRGHMEVDIAVAPAPYTAIRAWVESAPPAGQVAY